MTWEVRSYVAEPERGRRRWQDGKTGETPAEKRADLRERLTRVQAAIWTPPEIVAPSACRQAP